MKNHKKQKIPGVLQPCCLNLTGQTNTERSRTPTYGIICSYHTSIIPVLVPVLKWNDSRSNRNVPIETNGIKQSYQYFSQDSGSYCTFVFIFGNLDPIRKANKKTADYVLKNYETKTKNFFTK